MPQLSDRTVLLADDQSFILDMLKETLTRLGMNVITAKDGIEAIEQYQAHQDTIDAVILDCNMPRKNGCDVLKELRQQKVTIPIWLSSGDVEAITDDPSLQDLMTGVIPKPFRIHEIEEYLKQGFEIE